MAFLSRVRSHGKVYVYVTEYTGEQPFSTKRERHILSLGRHDRAIQRLEVWMRHPETFPIELLQRKLGMRDVEKWIEKLKEMSYNG